MADTASLTDAVDRAQERLFGLPNFAAAADSIHALEQKASFACGIFGVAVDAALLTKCGVVKADLLRTRCEQMLARLYAPDAMASFGPEERDRKTRLIKKDCTRFTKWTSIFGPLYKQAILAMKLK